MFPLPPGEAAVIGEIYRLFPGTREVETSALEPQPTLIGRNEGPSRGVVPASATAEESSPVSVKPVGADVSQASLFDERRAA